MRRNLTIVGLALAFAGIGAGVALAISDNSSSSASASTPTQGQANGRGTMTGYGSGQNASPVSTIAAAKARAQAFADTVGLHVGEVMQFKRNFYVALLDARDNSATEVLVDPATGYVSLEYGPAMMWNTTYGMMSGQAAGALMSRAGAMMGRSLMGNGMGNGMASDGNGMANDGSGMMGTTTTSRGGVARDWIGPSAPATPPTGPVSIVEARKLAQTWLDANQAGVKVKTGGDAFPGYFTLETLKDDTIVGMLSVNVRTGAVWPHWWHGAFVAMTE